MITMVILLNNSEESISFMWTFLLGLVLGTLLGLNYKLVINQLSSLLGIPEGELLQIHEAPAKPVIPTRSEGAPVSDKLDLSNREASSEQDSEKARTEERAKAGLKTEGEARSAPELAGVDSKIEDHKEVEAALQENGEGELAEKVQEKALEATGTVEKSVGVEELKRQDLEVEVQMPNWVDFPLRRPQIQFEFRSENGQHVLNEIFELGEKRSVSLERNTQYSLNARMIRMSAMVKPFSWSGRFNPSCSLSVADKESLRVTYLTPRTLRDRADLKIEVIPAVG